MRVTFKPNELNLKQILNWFYGNEIPGTSAKNAKYSKILFADKTYKQGTVEFAIVEFYKHRHEYSIDKSGFHAEPNIDALFIVLESEEDLQGNAHCFPGISYQALFAETWERVTGE